MGRYRTDLTFRRITPEESRIYQDGAIVGEVYRQEDILNAGAALLRDSPGRRPSRPRQGARTPPHSRRSTASRGHASALVVTMAGAMLFPGSRLAASFTGRVGRPLRAGLSAAIPARWRSREFPLLSLPPPLAGARCALRLPKKKRWAPMNAHPVVLSHCATRARSSNPAGPPLRSGLAQEGLGRAVKVADREDRLPETGDTSRGARLPLKRGAGVSGRRSQTARHAADSTQVPARLHRRASSPSARAWAGADRRAPRRPTRNERPPGDPAPALPGTVDAIFRTKIGDFPHQLPPKTF